MALSPVSPSVSSVARVFCCFIVSLVVNLVPSWSLKACAELLPSCWLVLAYTILVQDFCEGGSI